MREAATYPPGVPCWVDTRQPDTAAAMAFYGGVFGWVFDAPIPAGDLGTYRIARLGGLAVAAIAGADGATMPGAAWTTYVRVDRLDEAVAAVTAAGGRVLTEPTELLDLARVVAVADPAGAQFRLWEPRSLAGAQLVNEPATWNWSTLQTHDPAGAEEFYARVLGWEHTSIAPGVEDVAMVCLPGYGEALRRADPALGAGVAPDAPEGFADAVAWMEPARGDRSGEQGAPHWSVTFSVADTDATVDRVVELGGRVVTPPFDFPPVRTAEVADPHGVVFAVSRYDPTA